MEPLPVGAGQPSHRDPDRAPTIYRSETEGRVGGQEHVGELLGDELVTGKIADVQLEATVAPGLLGEGLESGRVLEPHALGSLHDAMVGEVDDDRLAGLLSRILIAEVAATGDEDGVVGAKSLGQCPRVVVGPFALVHDVGADSTERGDEPEPERAIPDVGVVGEVEQGDPTARADRAGRRGIDQRAEFGDQRCSAGHCEHSTSGLIARDSLAVAVRTLGGMSNTNVDLFERGKAVMPGGVNSPVRSFASVGGTPYFVDHAEGAHVWDIEGKRYIDYVMSYGPGILGHAHPVVVDAITTAVAEGTSYGAPTLGEVEMAEELVARVPGLEMIRLVSSGTEAAMSAIRLARGATGRDKIVKFAGHYHGHADPLLAAGGSGVANQGLSGCDGVPDGAVADTIVVPWNVVPELDDSIAALAVEPIPANMGLVPAREGFLEELRDACDAAGVLLLFDEVITGFRVARGGATERFGVQPDVWCFGKVIGGGLPVGAYGASREVMGHIAPLGGVYQAGTLSGNPLATAAGLAQLRQLDDEAYTQLERTAIRLADGLTAAFDAAGVAAVVPRVGPLVGLFFTDRQPTDFDEAKAAADNGVYPRFFHGMLERGVALAPGPYEALFPSLAHEDSIIDETIATAAEVAQGL